MNLPNLLIVLGFCLGTLGAAGLNQLARQAEPGSWLYLGAGVALLGLGGALGIARRRAGAQARHAAGRGLDWFRARIAELRDAIALLDESKAELEPRQLHQRIGALLEGPFFDLTARNQELIQLVGFGPYARIWDGVASAERLLARSWSMLTDGYPAEARAELSHARKAIEEACAA